MPHVPREKGVELGDPTFDAKLHARTLWEVREDRQSVIANQRAAPLDIGLALSASVLEDVDLVFDHTRQLPPEPLHAELLGISLLVFSTLVSMLKNQWRNALSAHLLCISTPWEEKLPSLALSKRERVKMNAEQVSRAVQLLPFALCWPTKDRIGDWLEPRMFSEKAHAELQARVGTGYCSELRRAFLFLATSNAAVFAESRASGTGSLVEMQSHVTASRQAFGTLFGTLLDRPNAHTTAAHMVQSADDFALPKNFDVRTYETKHGPFRRFISGSSSRVVERQMMEWANIQQALTYLARDDCAADASRHLLPARVRKAIQTDPVFAQLLGFKLSSNPHGGQDDAQLAQARWSIPRAEEEKGPWALTEKERTECGAGPADGVTNHTFVRLGGQPQHLRTISAGDAWECAPPPSWGDRSPPRGPRPGVAIVVVHSVFRVRAAVWVRVAWYKDSGAVQPTTTCPIYQGWNNKCPPCTAWHLFAVEQIFHQVDHVQSSRVLL